MKRIRATDSIFKAVKYLDRAMDELERDRKRALSKNPKLAKEIEDFLEEVDRCRSRLIAGIAQVYLVMLESDTERINEQVENAVEH